MAKIAPPLITVQHPKEYIYRWRGFMTEASLRFNPCGNYPVVNAVQRYTQVGGNNGSQTFIICCVRVK